MAGIDRDLLRRALARLARPALDAQRAMAWIDDWDPAIDLCPDCARKIARQLRRRRIRPDAMASVSCGPQLSDNLAECECCRVRLDVALTAFGAEQELDHWAHHPPHQLDPHDAADLLALLSALDARAPTWLLRAIAAAMPADLLPAEPPTAAHPHRRSRRSGTGAAP